MQIITPRSKRRRRKPGELKVYRPGYVIVADTREQAPFGFTGIPPLASEGDAVAPLVVRRTLATGDYSIVGMESVIAIERKSVADLFGTLGKGRERFAREFERLAAMKWAAVVVEGDYVSIRDCPPGYSRMSAESIEGTIDSWSIKFPAIHWFLCPDRRAAEIRTFRLLDKAWKYLRHDPADGRSIA
ncbi:MAG: ERCC4 domain-containing protein [Planctomycetaceae bacterium]